MPASPAQACVYGRPLLQLAREIGRHLATLHRWRDPGVLDPNGVRRRLRMTRVGGRWYVTDDALREFFDALGTGAGNVPTVETERSSVARSSHDEQVKRELNAVGLI